MRVAYQEQDVALHPEGVDRNSTPIEYSKEKKEVALHPEGVDRNFCSNGWRCGRHRRPPPGGRG